jgi:hypothetical protein
MREFDFSVMTSVNDDAATVLDLGYLEYPGELLTDPDAPGSDAQQRLLAAVGSADALIGIIDGMHVLQQVELSLDYTARQTLLAEAHRRTRMGPAEALRTLGVFVAERAGRMLAASVGAGVLSDAGLALFMESQTQAQPQNQRRLTALSEADRRAEAFIQARRRVISSLRHQVATSRARRSGPSHTAPDTR